MALREVNVNEIREVLRVWLGVAGLPAPGYRTIAAHCGLDRKTIRYAEFLSGVMILNLCVYAGRSFAYASASGASGCRGVVSGSMGAETAT